MTANGSDRVRPELQAQRRAIAAEGLGDRMGGARRIALLRAVHWREDGPFLYFPRRAAQAPKLRAFIDVAKQR